MPKANAAQAQAQARQKALARLPRRPGYVIEGGTRRLGIYVRDGDASVQPRIALWVDIASGFVLATTLVAPDGSPDAGVGEALDALLAALAPSAPPARPRGGGLGQPTVFGGLPGQEPGLPERLRVNDAALAAAAQAVLGPLGVAVEHVAEAPAFDAVYQAFAERMGADEDAAPPEPFSWDIGPAALRPLFKAAARYARRAPWETLLDHPPLAVALGAEGPAPGVDTLYASILGAGEEVFGVAFYYDADGYRRTASGAALPDGPSEEEVDVALALLESAGMPVDTIAPGELRDIVAEATGTGMDEGRMREAMEDCLLMFLDEEEEIDPTYVGWLEEHGVTFASRQDIPVVSRTMRGGESRLPDAREARALTLALEGLVGFIGKHRASIENAIVDPGTLTHTARVGEGRDRAAVTVTAPAPGFAWDDYEDDDYDDEEEEDGAPAEPPPLGAATTLYRFQVKLEWRKRVWRRIELRGDQTLHDLHRAIQAAFDWDDAHLYAFFLSGEAWDKASEYTSPHDEEGRAASRYPLASLPLRAGGEFLYIFDFGDELRHLVTLEVVAPGGVEPAVAYPRVAEGRGDAPAQYS